MPQALAPPDVDLAVPLRLVLVGSFDPVAMLPRRVANLANQAEVFELATDLEPFQEELWAQLLDRLKEAQGVPSGDDALAPLAAAEVPVQEMLKGPLGDVQMHRSLLRLSGGLRDAQLGLRTRWPLVGQVGPLFEDLDRAVHSAQLAQHVSQSDQVGIDTESTPLQHPILDPRWDSVRRFHFGSPLGIEMSITSVETPAGLIALLYAILKLSGIDLEIRLRRARLRSQLSAEEARQRARRLESVSTAEIPDDPLGYAEFALKHSGEDVVVKSTVDQWLTDTDLFPWKIERGEIADDDFDPPDRRQDDEER